MEEILTQFIDWLTDISGNFHLEQWILLQELHKVYLLNISVLFICYVNLHLLATNRHETDHIHHHSVTFNIHIFEL